jgi:hypothetical protein
MSPGEALVLAANAALQNEDVRASIRDMHAQSYPLVKMVEALGLEDDLTKDIRRVLEELPPDVIQGIRKATLQMLDGPSDQYAMPLECEVSYEQLEAGLPAHLEVKGNDGNLMIAVRTRTTV